MIRKPFWLIFVATLLACQITSPFAKPNYRQEGQQALDRGDHTQAVEKFTQAINEDQSNATLYYLRGSSYYGRYKTAFDADPARANASDFNLAIADFSKAIELSPNYAEAYSFRGTAYAGLDSNDLALADYNKAIQLKPDLDASYYGRAYLYEKMGKRELAIADYKRFLELTKDAYWRAEAEKRLNVLQNQLP
jgi:tetratricopeptide (TPR) repeat protein